MTNKVLRKERIRIKIGKEVYVYTGDIISQDDTKLIIDDWKEGEIELNKEDIVTRQEVKEVKR